MKIVPDSATVILDGDRELSGDNAYIKPGSHTVKVSKDGFNTVKKEYLIKDYNAPAIYIGLTGKTQKAKDWQKHHSSEYSSLDKLTTEQSHEYTKLFRDRNPIVKILPINDPYFTISYKNIKDKNIELLIRGTSPKYRKFALNYIREKGFTPEKYKVIFQGFNNPLLGGKDEQ